MCGWELHRPVDVKLHNSNRFSSTFLLVINRLNWIPVKWCSSPNSEQKYLLYFFCLIIYNFIISSIKIFMIFLCFLYTLKAPRYFLKLYQPLLFPYMSLSSNVNIFAIYFPYILFPRFPFLSFLPLLLWDQSFPFAVAQSEFCDRRNWCSTGKFCSLYSCIQQQVWSISVLMQDTSKMY